MVGHFVDRVVLWSALAMRDGDWGEAEMKDLYVGLRERNVLIKDLTTIYLLRVTRKVLVYSELYVTRNMFHPFGDCMGLDGQKRQEVANVAKGL